MQEEPEKKLIVNVDDVGLSDAVNEAAEKCYRENAITGVSVMVCGKRFQDAASMLRRLGKTEVGVHLTLAGKFPPCTQNRSAIKSLLSGEGTFVRNYRRFMLHYFQRRLNPDEIYLELANQIKKVRAEGLEVTHLDSHEHVHMIPAVLKITLRLANEFGVPYIRLPLEGAAVFRKQFKARDLARHAALKVFAARAKKAISGAGLYCNDAFLGHFHSGRINDDILCFMMENLPGGVTELALHPAVMSPRLLEDSPWHRNAPVELDALLNGKWRKAAETNGARLVTHKEAVLVDSG